MRKENLLLVAVFTLAGCVTTPESLQGDFAEVASEQARNSSVAPTRVRWGGEIIAVTPNASETCFEMVRYRLDDSARPVDSDQSEGRFIACGAGFYDPAIYAQGRELTVTGTLAKPSTGKIGDFDYRYPRVTVDTLYLWPQPDQRYARRGYYDPFFYGGFLGYRRSFFGIHGFSRLHW